MGVIPYQALPLLPFFVYNTCILETLENEKRKGGVWERGYSTLVLRVCTTVLHFKQEPKFHLITDMLRCDLSLKSMM